MATFGRGQFSDFFGFKRGLFIFYFLNSKIGFGIRMATFGGGVNFLTFLDLRIILDFWILKGSFIFFEILKMVFWIRMATFVGVNFLTFLVLRIILDFIGAFLIFLLIFAILKMATFGGGVSCLTFLDLWINFDFWILKGSFWVCVLTFWNSENLVWNQNGNFWGFQIFFYFLIILDCWILKSFLVCFFVC